MSGCLSPTKNLWKEKKGKKMTKSKMYQRQDVELIAIRLPNSGKPKSFVIFKLNIR